MALTLLLLLALGRPLAADADFVEGVRLYNELRFDEAAARFAAAVERPGLADSDNASALIWLAVCRANAGNLDGAAKVLDRAFALDKAAAIPVEVSPRIAALIDERRAKAPERPPPPEQPPPGDDHVAPPPTPGPPIVAWVVTGVGAACLAAAAVAGGIGLYNYSVAANPDEFYPTARAALTTSQTMAVLSGGLASAGVIGAAGGVALMFLE